MLRVLNLKLLDCILSITGSSVDFEWPFAKLHPSIDIYPISSQELRSVGPIHLVANRIRRSIYFVSHLKVVGLCSSLGTWSLQSSLGVFPRS